jgi:hypothetical protein
MAPDGVSTRTASQGTVLKIRARGRFQSQMGGLRSRHGTACSS